MIIVMAFFSNILSALTKKYNKLKVNVFVTFLSAIFVARLRWNPFQSSGVKNPSLFGIVRVLRRLGERLFFVDFSNHLMISSICGAGGNKSVKIQNFHFLCFIILGPLQVLTCVRGPILLLLDVEITGPRWYLSNLLRALARKYSWR